MALPNFLIPKNNNNDYIPSFLKPPTIRDSSQYGHISNIGVEEKGISEKLHATTPILQPKIQKTEAPKPVEDNGFWAKVRNLNLENTPIFKAITSPINKLYEIPFTQRLITTAGEAVAGPGAYKNDDGTDMRPMDTNSKLGNFTADVIGTGLGFGTKVPGLNTSFQGTASNAVNPIINKIPQVNKLTQYGTNALKGGLEFGALNTIQGLSQNQSLGDSLNRGKEGLIQGALFNTALKGAGDIYKSAFPKWKTTYEANGLLKNPNGMNFNQTLPTKSVAIDMIEKSVPKQEIIDQQIPKIKIKKEPNTDLLQRIEEPGISRATTDKPHGIYTTFANTKSPHQLGGDTYYWQKNPNANILNLEPYPIKSNRMNFPIETGSGVYATSKFLGKDATEKLMVMPKKQLVEQLSSKYPNIEWNKYNDQQEIVEGLGGILAREHGYDALQAIDKKSPQFSEYVLLNDKAGNAIDKPSKFKNTTEFKGYENKPLTVTRNQTIIEKVPREVSADIRKPIKQQLSFADKFKSLNTSVEPFKPQLDINIPNTEIKPLEANLKPSIGEAAATTEKVIKPRDITKESDILANSDNWKDKSMPLYNRETIERNLEDIAGTDAQRLKDTYIEPIKVNEANAVRQKNALRGAVNEFKIAAGSKDSELAQRYGEGLITLNDLKNSTDNWKNVKGLADHMRKSYDELIATANETLRKNRLKPIAVRENYMPHQGELDGIMKALGIEPTDLPTSINGLTPEFKPNKNFFANALQRKGEKTVYDAVRGYDNYIEGITKIINHTDDIGRLRGLEKAIREKYGDGSHLNNFVSYLQNYTNQIAGKQSRLDRGAEETVGRGVYKAADTVRKQVSSNAVGANISSALTNFIPLTQSLATTDKASFVKGLYDAFANVFHINKDDFVNKSDFLTRRFGSDRLGTKLFSDTGTKGDKLKQFGAVAWNKSAEGANTIFKFIDNLVGQTIVRGKYYEGLKNGMPEKEALKYADNWAGRIMADRSLGMTPTLLNNKVISLLAPFQTEVNNQMSFLFKDLPRTYNKTQLASKVAQIALYSYVFDNLYERATGRRPAFDVLGVAEQAYNDYTGKDVPLTNYLGKERIKRDVPLPTNKANKNLINNVANQLPFTSVLTGGRIPVGNAIPDFIGMATGTADAKNELLAKPFYYGLLPTGGGQLKKTIEGLSAIKNQGAYSKNGNQMNYPIEPTTSNKMQGAIFGKSSLPETKAYYANGRTPLSAEQTKIMRVAGGLDKPTTKIEKQMKDEKLNDKTPQQIYNKILDDRAINKVKDEVYNYKQKLLDNNEIGSFHTKLINDRVNGIVNGSYTKEEKIKQLKAILDRIKKEGNHYK